MRKQLHVGAFAILACLSNAAVAQVIDFEPDGSGKLPDGVTDAADDIPITDEFASVGGLGITFGIDADRDLIADIGVAPLLEEIGPTQTGSSSTEGFLNDPDSGGLFKNDPAVYDKARTPALEAQLGQYFLRTPENLTDASDVVLLIEYGTAVDAASGELWDIDGNSFVGNERYIIKAFNGSGAEIGSVTSPLGDDNTDANPFESAPWIWSFDFSTSSETISKIRIEFDTGAPGAKTSLVGLAFNNFNATEVPEPAGLAIMVAGGLIMLRRQRR